MLSNRYNGPARKRAITDEIRAISIATYTANGDSEAKALQRVARRIEKLVPQQERGRNGDREKREALYYAIREKE